MADRPLFEFCSSSGRTTYETCNEVQALDLLGHIIYYTKEVATGEYRGILSSLDAVEHYQHEQCDTSLYIGSIRRF